MHGRMNLYMGMHTYTHTHTDKHRHTQACLHISYMYHKRHQREIWCKEKTKVQTGWHEMATTLHNAHQSAEAGRMGWILP